MKRSLIALALVIFTICGACAQTKTQTFNFGNFTSIKASYAYTVNVSKGGSNQIELICPERLAEYLEVSVLNGTLVLSADMPKSNFWNRSLNMKDGEKIIVNVQMEEIEGISLSGAASLNAAGEFKTNYFKLTMSGASEIDEPLNIQANKFTYALSGASEAVVCGMFHNISGHISGASEFELNADAATCTIGCSGASELKYTGNITEKVAIECSGASEVNMKGICSDISIQCSGASEVDAEEMRSQYATATASGASSIKVYADAAFTLKATGGSKIRYYGNGKYTPQGGAIARGR